MAGIFRVHALGTPNAIDLYEGLLHRRLCKGAQKKFLCAGTDDRRIQELGLPPRLGETLPEEFDALDSKVKGVAAADSSTARLPKVPGNHRV